MSSLILIFLANMTAVALFHPRATQADKKSHIVSVIRGFGYIVSLQLAIIALLLTLIYERL